MTKLVPSSDVASDTPNVASRASVGGNGAAQTITALLAFVALTFGWAWCLWMAGSALRMRTPELGNAVFLLAGFGPSLAGLVIVWGLEGGAGLRRWWQRCASTTNIAVGSAVAGALGTLTVNSPSVVFATTVSSIAMAAANVSALYLGLGGAAADATNRLSLNAPAPVCQGSCPLLHFSSISQMGGIG